MPPDQLRAVSRRAEALQSRSEQRSAEARSAAVVPQQEEPVSELRLPAAEQPGPVALAAVRQSEALAAESVLELGQPVRSGGLSWLSQQTWLLPHRTPARRVAENASAPIRHDRRRSSWSASSFR
jgi:hypothetical protein